MNRQALAEATSLHDGPVPIYIMEEIARSTKESPRDAEKVVDFMLGRLNKSNLIVKLKALQLIAYCIREGSPAFAGALREEEQEIAAYLQYTGPPDPVYGDERYRRIRVAAQEALVCLNDGSLSRHSDAVHNSSAPGGNSWQSGPQNGAPPAPYRDQPSFGDSAPSYGGASNYDQQQQQPGAQPWGNNSSSSSQYPSSRPAPYQDTPAAGSYGGNPSGGYNAPPAGGAPQYGGGGVNSSYGQNNGGGYGQSAGAGPSGAGGYGPPDGGNGGYGYNSNAGPGASRPSGLDSWSSASVGGAPAKSAGSGMWSSSGYQKKDPSASPDLPRYNASRLARDNRPTVLVGHSLNFPKPAGGFGSSSGGYGGNTGGGGYGGNTGGVYGGNSGVSGYGGNTGVSGYGGNAGGAGYGGTSVSGYGGNSGGMGGFSSNHQSSGVPGFMNNSNTFSSNRAGMGMTNTQPLHVNQAPTTKLGKTVEGLKKISNEARERWDRRNMDKSMASSLADHDELRAGPQVMDRGYQYQPNAQQGTGGGDTSRDYERGLIDNLCASVGLSRAPPADALKRFVDLAQTLDVQTIGDILLDKLEDPSWQVRLKGLHVVVALLESPNGAPYMDWFEENVDVLEELRKDGKPSVVSKTLQVLRILGFADESEPQPPVQKRVSVARSDRSASSSSAAHPADPSHAQQQGSYAPAQQQTHQEEVDLLGFGSLSIQQPPQAPPAPAAHNVVQAPNIYGSPPSMPVQAPPAPPQQEVSLLDDFDPLNSSNGSNYSAQQLQQQQQQYAQQQYQHQQQYQPQQHQQQMYQHQPPPQQQGLAPPAHLPPQSLPAAMDDRSQTLSHFGKDLFTIANSPRNSASSLTDSSVSNSNVNSAEKSAFGFL